ncbi:MAG: hydroxyethylthiazole kinase [Acidiferrobacterales bacterium]|nr:hydroxyethylthiazole kinase [Acidiferrobacterales bacterium]
MTDTADKFESSACSNPLAQIRALHPRVHCIVNEAAVSLTANVLLACGASPCMTHDPHEVAQFTNSSDALSINLGMLTQSKCRAIMIASDTASDKQIPWVLDPTLCDRSQSRLDFCTGLIKNRPSALRGNSAEIDSICRSMDLTREELAREHSIVVMTTGEFDHVISDNRTREITSGHPWMESVTGLGCAFSALLAASLTVRQDPFDAAVEIAQTYGSIGQTAAQVSHGPGTYAGNFLDCIHAESIR